MTYKERIAWYLALQQIDKLSRHRIAPAIALQKKQAKLSSGENFEVAPKTFQRHTPLTERFASSKPPANIIQYQKKSRTSESKSDTVTSASLPPQLSAKTFEKTFANVQPVTKHEQRLFVKHIYSDNAKHFQVFNEHLAILRGGSPVRTGESAALKDKSFAPTHIFPPSTQHITGDSLEVAQYDTHRLTKATTAGQKLAPSLLNFERSFQEKFPTSIPLQERDSVVDQDQVLSGSNASASTLHLDGSSLGRWAVQHLERILSKPPAGMTGVDPRATVPRSRVAPF